MIRRITSILNENRWIAGLVTGVLLIGMVTVSTFPAKTISNLLDGMLFSSAITVAVLYGWTLIIQRRKIPANVFAVRLGIVMSWSASAGLSGYRIFHSLIRTGAWSPPFDPFRLSIIICAIVAAGLHIVAVGINDADRDVVQYYLCAALWAAIIGFSGSLGLIMWIG